MDGYFPSHMLHAGCVRCSLWACWHAVPGSSPPQSTEISAGASPDSGCCSEQPHANTCRPSETRRGRSVSCFSHRVLVSCRRAESHAGGLTLFLMLAVDPPSSRRRAVWACAFWQARWSAVFPAYINKHCGFSSATGRHCECDTLLLEFVHSDEIQNS